MFSAVATSHSLSQQHIFDVNHDHDMRQLTVTAEHKQCYTHYMEITIPVTWTSIVEWNIIYLHGG